MGHRAHAVAALPSVYSPSRSSGKSAYTLTRMGFVSGLVGLVMCALLRGRSEKSAYSHFAAQNVLKIDFPAFLPTSQATFQEF